MYAVLLFLTLTLGLTNGATLPVTFDCSQVECTTDSDSCPPDSIERPPAPAFDVLYGPEELMSPHDFYDEVDDLGDAMEAHFDELPMELSEVTALPVNSTVNQLTSERDTKDLEAEKGPEHVLVKRQLQFDHGPTEDMDAHERMLQMCCPTITLESLRRRRRRRYTSVEDCKCKACQPLPQCPSGEVAVRLHEAKGVPGDCCATYACAPKRECGEAGAQPYWRDACTRCSCHGENGPELCHNECPMNEMGEIETERSCYATNSEEPMLHGSDWFENDWCTECHCENGERECVGSLCLPTTCSNPVKVAGQCCPQCPVGVENILIAHENATESTISSPTGKELQDESTTTTTVSTTTENSTTAASTASPAIVTSTLAAIESSSESTTAHVGLQNEKDSTEEHTELVYSSSISTEVTASSTDVTPSTTESTTTTRSIDDIASEIYYGPMIYTSTEQSSTPTQEILYQTGENITQSTLEPQADISSSTASSCAESTSTVEQTSTTTSVSSNSEPVSTETSTTEASSSTENSTELSTTASTSIADDASSTTVADIYNEAPSTTETSQATPIASSKTESTTTTNSKPTASTTTELDTTSTTTAISSTNSAESRTTVSTTTLLPLDTSSTHIYSPSTSAPHTSTVNPPTSTTFTTNSPYSSTAATQTVSTVVYWYTFSTSAPSPPIPQPTIYQPSVRQFFTRPEVRYIGAAVIAAFTVISALAVWKFCMPTRTDRLKNHYRTVPSSEATSLSHISSTSHSSMA